MLPWEKNIPKHLTEKSNIQRFVIFTAFFALVFINFYAPFGVVTWYDVTELQLFFYSSIVILIGMLVVVISRVIMLQAGKIKTLKYGEYALWITAEIISMALMYTVIQHFFLDDPRDFLTALKKSVQITALVILLPYIMLWLYLSWREKNNELERLANITHPETATFGMIPFPDEKGILKLSIKKHDLLYLESSDNYVTIYYLDQNKISKYLLRNSLKNLEMTFQGMGLVRCHRSFLVNFDKVKLIMKEKDGLIIELDVPQKLTLPVSRTYIDIITGMFGRSMI